MVSTGEQYGEHMLGSPATFDLAGMLLPKGTAEYINSNEPDLSDLYDQCIRNKRLEKEVAFSVPDAIITSIVQSLRAMDLSQPLSLA